MGTLILIILALFGLGLLAWWLLITTEGVYLGRRTVIWLYDIYARRYDRIKNYDPPWEAATLARPIQRALLDIPAPLILDVATGTARLPLALFRMPTFNGYVIGLDYSRRMLTVAAEKLAAAAPLGHRAELIYQPAQHLPFNDATFDGVACLEALEFMPDPDAVIAELIRVARPGALILLTNRKGVDARLMPGKTQSSRALAARLQGNYGLEEIIITAWQIDYEQIWAFKPGELIPAPEHALEAVLCCPRCGQRELARVDSARMSCRSCGVQIAVGDDGVIEYASWTPADSQNDRHG